jgi:hypothetical protein
MKLQSARNGAVKKFIKELEARCTKGGIYPVFVARTEKKIAEEMTEGNHEAL